MEKPTPIALSSCGTVIAWVLKSMITLSVISKSKHSGGKVRCSLENLLLTVASMMLDSYRICLAETFTPTFK